jgi:hypothetical protein
VPARRAALMLVVVCLPTLVAAAGIMTWNRYRTGDYVLAMVSETVFLIASLKAAEKDAGVFAGTGVLDRTARASLSDYDYGDAQKITERLFREHGLTAPALYRLARQKYIETVLDHPRAYVLSMLDRFRFAQQASLVGDLLMRLDDLAYWRYVDYHVDYYGGWRATARMLKDTWDMRLLTPALAMKIVPRVLTRAASIVLFLSFVVVLPVLLWRDLSGPGPARRRQAVFLASLYALYWAVFGIHLLVSVEMRYLGLICSIPIVGAIVVVRRLLRGGRPAAEVRAR